jgi:hypothetical protein
MERHYARWYGPSAVHGKSGERRLNEARSEQGLTDELRNDQPAAKFNLDTFKASFRDLDEAARLVADRPSHVARVDQIRMYWHYLYLRHRLDEAEQTKNEEAILNAIEAELKFGGRLASSNLIHARPLLGKAILRRFKKFEWLLSERPEVQKEGQGWRQIGQPPSHAELEQLWQADKKALRL